MKRLGIVATVIFLMACGASSFATSLRVVIAAGAPVLQTFVAQGKISDSFRLQLLGDLNEEAGYVGQLGGCFDAIAKGDAQSRSKHLQCVQTFETQTRPVLQRHFRTNPTVSMIADDIDAVIQAAIIFYGGAPKGMTRASAAPTTEKDIDAKIKQLKKDLGQQ